MLEIIGFVLIILIFVGMSRTEAKLSEIKESLERIEKKEGKK